MKYQNCIFDLYGTLVDIHTDEGMLSLWEKMAYYYNFYGANYQPEELRDAYFRIVSEKEHGHEQRRQDSHEAHPEIQIEYVFRELYQRKRVEADMKLAVRMGQFFRELSTKYIRLYDGVLELLQALKAQGRGLYLLSNAQRIFTERELHNLGLEPFFDGIFLSSDYTCKKPDRRFYEIMLKSCSIAPESAIMIGNDGVCDVQGAREVGLSTLYIRTNISPREPLPAADYILEGMNWERVMEILNAD